MENHASSRGCHGDLLELYGSQRYAQAKRSGLTLKLSIIFRVMRHWKTRRFHSLIGKSGLVVENPAIKRFLQVRIAHSEELHRCMLGGTIWKLIL